MQINDLVQVQNQGKLNGTIAVVTELNNPPCDGFRQFPPTVATIAQLELTGNAHVVAMLPVDDLIVVNDTAQPQWRAAYAVWKGIQIKNDHPAVLAVEQADKIIDLVANKYGISSELLRNILIDLEDLGVI